MSWALATLQGKYRKRAWVPLSWGPGRRGRARTSCPRRPLPPGWRAVGEQLLEMRLIHRGPSWAAFLGASMARVHVYGRLALFTPLELCVSVSPFRVVVSSREQRVGAVPLARSASGGAAQASGAPASVPRPGHTCQSRPLTRAVRHPPRARDRVCGTPVCRRCLPASPSLPGTRDRASVFSGNTRTG